MSPNKIVKLKAEHFHVDEFLKLNDKYPKFLFRAFELQRDLRQQIVSGAFWRKLTIRRNSLGTIKDVAVDATWDTQAILEALGYRTSYSAMVPRGPR